MTSAFHSLPSLPSFIAWVISSTPSKGVMELEEELDSVRKTLHSVKSSSIRIVINSAATALASQCFTLSFLIPDF